MLEQSDHGTVSIGAVETHITEQAWKEGWVGDINPPEERDGRVAIIGAGPAGLSAAERLRKHGWQVRVYDRHDRPGGMMIYGIPGFKMEKSVVSRRTDRLARGGVEFITSTDVGRDISFAELRAQHDAVLITTGVYKPRELQAPGRGLDGIIHALPYLITSNRVDLGDLAADAPEAISARDRHVLVIGGGDTAMDCVRTAVRQQAREVRCMYRRDRANMPGSAREVGYAESEGVLFEWLTTPKGFDGTEQVSTVWGQRMTLGPPDASGRRQVSDIEGASVTFHADMVILALGFEPENMPEILGPESPLCTRWGTIIADATGRTNLDRVYAAGDIVRGASLVVWAIHEGQLAAESIDHDLRIHTGRTHAA